MHHVCRCPQRSGSLELDLQRVVNGLIWVLGTKSGSSARSVQALTTEQSLWPQNGPFTFISKAGINSISTHLHTIEMYSQMGIFFTQKQNIYFSFARRNSYPSEFSLSTCNKFNIKALHCSLPLRTVPRFGRKGLPIWNKLTSKENPAYFEGSTSSPDFFHVDPWNLDFLSFFLHLHSSFPSENF